MVTHKDIADKLEATGLDHYSVDYERGVAVVFFQGLLAEETPCQTEERRRRGFKERYYWAGHELRRRAWQGPPVAGWGRPNLRNQAASDSDYCVVCGAYVPEGNQVCPNCRPAGGALMLDV